MLVEWLSSRNLSAEYQWLRWEPSIVPIIKRFRKLTGRTAKPNSSPDDVVKTENTDHAKWSGLKKNLFSSGLFRSLWITYATRDYYQAYKKVSPNWTADILVMDRYLFDFLADQSINLQLNTTELNSRLNRSPYVRMEKPQVNIIIDIPAQVGYERKSDGTPLSYLQQREDIYRNFSLPGKTLHIDGQLPLEQVHGEICKWLITTGIIDE